MSVSGFAPTQRLTPDTNPLTERWLSATPPSHIRPGVMIQRWLDLSFIHWRFDPEVVSALLPADLTPDVFDGAAWIGLIPFRLEVRAPGTPTVPWLNRFAETNVRAYVRGPDGEPGIWFLSCDVARLTGALAVRTSYRLPFMWADMTIQRDGQRIRYTGTRRWPGAPEATLDLALEHGRPRPVSALGAFERFVACRWRLYSPARRTLPPGAGDFNVTIVDHPEWQIAPARILHLDSTMLQAAGLPTPAGKPIAHFSPGVTTHFAGRKRVS